MLTLLIGKSASGKDSIRKQLVEEGFLSLLNVTTRPIREGEQNGVEYEFVEEEEFQNRISSGYFIEHQKYATIQEGKPATWYYGTPKINIGKDDNYVKIVDVEGAKALLSFYGKENCFVVYLYAEDLTRQKRAMERGSYDAQEWVRRLDSDAERFTPSRVGEVTNYIALNQNDIQHTIYYLTKALVAYSKEPKDKDKKYFCSLYEDEEDNLRIRVKSESGEVGKRIKRIEDISRE